MQFVSDQDCTGQVGGVMVRVLVTDATSGSPICNSTVIVDALGSAGHQPYDLFACNSEPCECDYQIPDADAIRRSVAFQFEVSRAGYQSTTVSGVETFGDDGCYIVDGPPIRIALEPQ